MSSSHSALLNNYSDGISSRSTSPVARPTNNSANQPKSSATRRNAPTDLLDRATTHPLMASERINPPIANPEIDDDVDDREVVRGPYPGVDDGFFSTRANDDGPTTTPPDDVENLPKPNPTPAIPEIPSIDGDDRRTHTTRGHTPRIPTSPHPRQDPHVPDFVGSERPTSAFPTFPDLEFGTIAPDLETLPDVNVYQHKKTLAQGMMDLALFSANANQLRYVLDSSSHPYYYSGIVLISISLLFQVAVGVGLIWNSRYNVKDEKEICIANKINNFTIIGIFLVTVINVFISAFGVASVQPVVIRSGGS